MSQKFPRKLQESGVQVPRDVDDDDALVAAKQQERLQDRSAFVMKQMVIPMALDQLRNQDGNLLTRIRALGFENVIHNWGKD